ncbi:MAG: allophanate hydrolase subunit 1 [Pseudomonadota bacterium]|nr:allophanate hydrolase subunit 1 [Pseudomonadota bacterium]
MTDWPRYRPVADHALLVSFGTEIGDEMSAQVLALDARLAENTPVGVVEWVPALVNLLIDFDPEATDHGALQAEIERMLTNPAQTRVESTERIVEVCYDADFAPDLAAVAETTGHDPEAVVRAHLDAAYRVRMYGFSPGYAYMSGVPEAIQVPRKPAAVRDVPAGSVIIAGPQCLVTTLTMPTGWSIIGRSPTRIMRSEADHPFLFDVGDSVRFVQIDRATFDDRLAEGADG